MAGLFRQLSAGLRDLELSQTAAALSFTTLVALVPLASVALTIVAHFPIFDLWVGALEKFLLRHMLPGSASAIVHTYILGFADRASRLRGVSLAVIAGTGILLFAMVEREINVIFGVSRKRPLMRRVPIYRSGCVIPASRYGGSRIPATSAPCFAPPTHSVPPSRSLRDARTRCRKRRCARAPGRSSGCRSCRGPGGPDVRWRSPPPAPSRWQRPISHRPSRSCSEPSGRV